MKSFSVITILLLAAAASAHFQLSYPPSRGDDDETQATGPCGGLDTPSAVRTPWGLTGGVLKFVAGHDEADTAVYLGLGNSPNADDFNIILADEFLQIGLGTFCWNNLAIPTGTKGIANGVNATIQVVQAGHTSGGLYNCADITFVSDPPLTTTDCANSSGISAEAVPTTAVPSASSTSNITNTASPTATSTNVASKITGGVIAAGILAAFGFVL